MQIYFERSGGFAGIRFHTTINTEDLPPQTAEPIEEMVHGARFFELPERINESEGHPDVFYYRLTVTDGDHSHTVEVSGNSIPDDLQPLVQELMQIARTRRTR